MSAASSRDPLAEIRSLSGLDRYLGLVESKLGASVSGHAGRVAAAGSQALASGGKRLRPLLVFLSTATGTEPQVASGVAVELVHLATLVHDDLLDRAPVRRGRPSTWSEFGEQSAVAGGDYLFARAFAALAETGDPASLEILAGASLALAHGEALQRQQRFDSSVSVEAYLERCKLKTGSLFAAACRLGAGDPSSSLGEFGELLGVAFQIVDDVLDCSGETIETGKVPGTDLHDGVPTLPLLLAAADDEVVREALEGRSREGALARVAATGALERSLETAAELAQAATEHLNGQAHCRELEILARAVVERKH